jgi:hypothetical protein
MSITQTYYLAHKARAKLSSEAARPDHNLRLLVGHANLLDSLMLDLADAEREQESWFNESVRKAAVSKPQQQQSPQKPTAERHIQWADRVVEEPDEDWHAEDADSDDDSSSDSDSEFGDDEDVEMADAVSLRRVPSHTVISPPTSDEDEELEEDDEEEDYETLRLTRSHSHSHPAPQHPPELVDHDSSDESEDEPSPPTPLFDTSHLNKENIKPEKSFYDAGYYVPPRNSLRLAAAATAISTY